LSGLRVALDGPGSSGKSSVGAAAAARLGYRFLDTGVLYRAITLLSVLREIEPDDQAGLVAVVPELELVADDAGRMRQVRIDGHDVTDQLHVPAVDRRVSAVSAQADVRESLLQLQRDLATAGDIILAGRDIGTVVLPDADLKLYLQVSVEERAQRRAAERGLDGGSAEAATILADLERRDDLDSSRAVAPLRIADDAVIVSSDGREFDDTVAAVVQVIRERAEQGTTPG
jgi:cytidylate kinase